MVESDYHMYPSPERVTWFHSRVEQLAMQRRSSGKQTGSATPVIEESVGPGDKIGRTGVFTMGSVGISAKFKTGGVGFICCAFAVRAK